MLTAFLIGITIGFAAFAYSLNYRYQNLNRKMNETRSDRLKRVFKRVAWTRVALYTVISGVLAVVAWHGLADILNATIDTWRTTHG